MFLEVAGIIRQDDLSYPFKSEDKILWCYMEHTPYPRLTLWNFKELFTLAITKKESFRRSSFT